MKIKFSGHRARAKGRGPTYAEATAGEAAGNREVGSKRG